MNQPLLYVYDLYLVAHTGSFKIYVHWYLSYVNDNGTLGGQSSSFYSMGFHTMQYMAVTAWKPSCVFKFDANLKHANTKSICVKIATPDPCIFINNA